MFRFITGAFLIATLCLGALLTQPAHAAATWNTAYSTTFSDLANYDIGNWHGNSSSNGELETYQPSQVVALLGGGVQLIAQKTSAGKYISGLIQTDGYLDVAPGSYITATIQVPKGQGFWPAFWLWNNAANSRTEFDIMEIVSPDFTTSESSIHANKNPQDRDFDYHCACDFSAGFHTFAMWWEKSFIAYSIDGVEFWRATTNIPTESMFVVFNFAIGGFWPGNPNSTTPFPSTMTIKNFSVFTHASSGIPSAPPIGGTAPAPTPTSTSLPSPTPTIVPPTPTATATPNPCFP